MRERQRAVITGGSSGIGAALARHLAGRGLDVLVTGRDADALEAVRADFESRIRAVPADLATPRQARTVSEAVGEEPIDFLVHAAGTLEPVAPLASVSPEDWRASFAINLDAAVFLVQALLDRLEGGRVLLVSSGAAHRPIAHWGAYCCAKAALVMLCDCLNVELNPRRILAASVRPGVVDTPMQTRIRDCDASEFPDVHRYRELHEQGKLHAPGTVAAFLGWLLLECGDGAFADRQWNIDDPDHHPLWDNTE